MYSKALIVAAALVGCHHVTPTSAFRATRAPVEMGTCSSPPEPVCFDDGIRDNEEACGATDGCIWESFDTMEDDGEMTDPPMEGDDMMGSGNCMVEQCNNQDNTQSCMAFDGCMWNAEDEMCFEAEDDNGGSGSGSGEEIEEESVCFGDDLREDMDACNANAACMWESYADPDGEENDGTDSPMMGGMCAEIRCNNQDSATDCAAWSESDVSEDECLWNAEDEMCEMVMDDGDTDGSGSGSGSEEMDDCANYNNNRGECEMYGCDFAATMMTTLPATTTTMSPTMSPTMPPVRPPTNSAGTCPRNCGTAARGGGTCRANGRCTSCNVNRVIQSGRCYSAISCKGRRIQSGSQAGSNCRCLDPHCHFCNRVSSGDTCRVCRDGWYLMNAECFESCPATLASSGVGQFKRRCAEPFVCQSGRLVGQSVSYGCKCATEDNSAIAQCQFCNHRAGEHGEHCTKCNGGMFLWMNRCTRSNCDGLSGMVEYAPGQYGRECRAPFTCTDRTDPDGGACKCPNSVGKNDCAVCDYGVGGVSCSRCTNNMYLRNGACEEGCREGETMVGEGRDGRECQ